MKENSMFVLVMIRALTAMLALNYVLYGLKVF